MKWLNALALAIIIVGGINWGVVGLLNFDLVGALFGYGDDVGERSMLARVIYIVVGLAALYACSLQASADGHESRGADSAHLNGRIPRGRPAISCAGRLLCAHRSIARL